MPNTIDRMKTTEELKHVPFEMYARVLARAECLESKIVSALDVAYKYSQIDGAHHKAWSIDQLVRALTGDNYDKWVAEYCAGKDGSMDDYIWDIGIPP